MLRTPSAIALGACVFATAFAAQHLIAPYAGLGLALYCGIAFSTLLGFAIGCLFGTRTAPERTTATASRALLAAAVLTLLVAFLRRPLLVALWHVDVRVTIAVASVLFAALPIICLGLAFGAGASHATAAEALGQGAWLIAGAALAAPVAGYALVPLSLIHI